MKQDIKSFDQEQLCYLLNQMNEQPFRAKQIFCWLHKGCRSFEEMSNLPKSLRQKLDEGFYITVPKIVRKLCSSRDGTIKYLLQLSDGNCVETVLMQYHHGNTVCISSEVGCAMGCAFCASTKGGLVRRLTPSEMIDQVLFTSLDSGRSISNIVLMGIGEPLDNFEAVKKFLRLINHPDGLNIGMRHISLSTCGIADRIMQLADEKLQITLSVSLHAPTDELRSRIMPINKKYPVDRLLEACRIYFKKTGRRISFEYAMIRDLNDTKEIAHCLASCLQGMETHVNLIPLNYIEESPLKPSVKSVVKEFQKVLEMYGIPATVRRTLGSDIDASCGQLRRNFEQSKQEV